MNNVFIASRSSFLRKWIASVIITAVTLSPTTTYAQGVIDLPRPSQMVLPSEAFVPVLVRAIAVHPDQPFVFDFIIDSGNTKASQEEIKQETEKMAKYFLAALTIPEKDLWVNLSPYENDRIVPEAFGQTGMGRDLLAQDYILKQLTASLVYPEKELGKEFWARVYGRAQKELGTSELPANTFNKVWIMPDKAVVYEVNGTTAVVGESHLKVMMEEDYLALQKNLNNSTIESDQISDDQVKESSHVASSAMRDIVLPEIEKEVNIGKNFALLRQIYQAMILATWYKKALRESLLSQVYSDQNKVQGVDIADKAEKDKIYERYIDAYKQGVFNYIKEETDPVSQEVTPRKYFSGGGDFVHLSGTEDVRKTSAGQVPSSKVGEFTQATIVVSRNVPGPDSSQMTGLKMKHIISSNIQDFTGVVARSTLLSLPIAGTPFDLNKTAKEGGFWEQESPTEVRLNPGIDNKVIEAALKTVGSQLASDLMPILEQALTKLNGFDTSVTGALYKKSQGSVGGSKKALGPDLVPTATMTPDQLGMMGVLKNERLHTTANLEAATHVSVKHTSVNGGLGTTDFERALYDLLTWSRHSVSTKGIDAAYELQMEGFDERGQPKTFNEKLSVTEIKFLIDMAKIGKKKRYAQLELQELLTPDGIALINKFMDEMIYLPDRLNRPDEITGKTGHCYCTADRCRLFACCSGRRP
ncbi:MAG: hypothetical protein HQL18_00620 [Candidatus Omnitrophica bacterium]|nr:hypothetical protein [Candidatus Omnitrophota bacterium]